MKRIIALALIGLVLLCAGCAKAPSPPESTAPAAKSGGLAVTIDYEKQSGSASNQYAVWIEDIDGNLIKTLYATAYTAKGGWKNRPDSLALWVSKAMGISDFDAFASATPKSSGTWSSYWDLTDEAGGVVLPGTYRFLVEGTLRWKNHVIFTGEIEIGGANGIVEAVPEFFFAGEGRQPALDEDAPECGMITNVKAEYVA